MISSGAERSASQLLETDSSGVAVGDVLAGRYRVTRALGEGGMAFVFEGEHVRLGQRVAIKVVRPELAQYPEMVDRFEREGRAVSRLRSPHVARVFDVDVTEAGVPFLAMELLSGRDLSEEIANRGAIPVETALRWVREACGAVAEANELGVVHRDLKPSNLFLAESPGRPRTLKVLDFGIATDPTMDDGARITRTEMVMGTPAYMAPEQFRSAKNVDARADVWALGATLFELLAGRPPFLGSTTTIGVVITSDPLPDLASFRSDLPRGLLAVVERALEKDRDKRFATVRELEEALAAFSKDASEARRSSNPGAPSDLAGGAHVDSPLTTSAIITRRPAVAKPRSLALGIGVAVAVALTAVLASLTLSSPRHPVRAPAAEATHVLPLK